MNFLAISGSGRRASTNSAMLRAVAAIAAPDHEMIVFDRVADLPVFSPDREALPLPAPVETFVSLIRQSDGLIIASPEYVHAIPGGLKNAIDWLVSRDEIIGKPIALLHASHRGDEMLAQLRRVLSTVSDRFTPDLFLRFDLMKMPPDEIAHLFEQAEHREAVSQFVRHFAAYCCARAQE